MDALARFLSTRPMPAAIVAGVASRSGLAAIRALARAGAPVVALDHRPDALGFRSRFAFPALSPDPRDRERLLEFAHALGERLGRPAPVFPVTGEYAEAFAAAANCLRGRFLVASSRNGVPAGAPADESVRVEYWALLGADVRAVPVDGSRDRFGLGGVDPGPAIAAALRRARGRRR